jgi:hypothetical protein
MISIAPASTIEEEVYQRLISYIPEGRFYLRAAHTQPRRNGKNSVNFLISGYRGAADSDGVRVMMDVYLNNEKYTRVAMTNDTVIVPINLEPPPTINFVRIVEGYYDPATDLFTPTGESGGTSCVVTNFGSVFYGAALDYYRNVWLPYQTQERSLLSEWSSRLVEWYFKYHQQFPDTSALRTLATRLTSRSTWNEQPSTRGVIDSISALCATTPVVLPLTNERETWDMALYPLVPVVANHGGWSFDVWFPDLPSAREVALLRLIDNVESLTLKDHREGHIFLTTQDQSIELFKDITASNLTFLLRHMGPMDGWRGFLEREGSRDIYFRFWANPLDNAVVGAGLGVADPFDSDSAETTFDATTFDTSDPELFTDLWMGLNVSAGDSPIWGMSQSFDSVVQVAKGEGQIAPEEPVAWEWEWTGVLNAVMSTSYNVTNTLHGGAPPAFEA